MEEVADAVGLVPAGAVGRPDLEDNLRLLEQGTVSRPKEVGPATRIEWVAPS